jgi:hypothetical protein
MVGLEGKLVYLLTGKMKISMVKAEGELPFNTMKEEDGRRGVFHSVFGTPSFAHDHHQCKRHSFIHRSILFLFPFFPPSTQSLHRLSNSANSGGADAIFV